MGFFGSAGNVILNKFKRAQNDSKKAVADEDEALTLEQQEESDQTKVSTEVRAFSLGLNDEAAILKNIAAMQASKYSLVRVFATTTTATRNLGAAKKRLFSNLVQSGKRISTLTSRARFGGAVAISPSFGREMKLWLQEQQKELELMSSQVALDIKEEEEEAAAVSPVLEKNRQIRAELAAYSTLLGKENMQLGVIKSSLLRKIRSEQKELELTRDALKNEIDDLRLQRGV